MKNKIFYFFLEWYLCKGTDPFCYKLWFSYPILDLRFMLRQGTKRNDYILSNLQHEVKTIYIWFGLGLEER